MPNGGGARDDKLNGAPCDNISEKNKSFCELTAIYWAWKNIKKLYPGLEYIGANHYRRYFSFAKGKAFSSGINLPEKDVQAYKIDLGKLERILTSSDVVVAKRSVLAHSLAMNYCAVHYSSDLRALKRIVHEKHPEYDKAMYDVMQCRNKISYGNLCIMKWQDFDAYCAWLFDILFEAERKINISCYDAMQQRIFGYMAERLFNVWIAHNKLKAKHLPVLRFANAHNNSTLYNACVYAKCNLSHFFSKPCRKFSPERYAAQLKLYEDALERLQRQ